MPGVHSGATYNDLHAGIELKLSDDESLLFVVRNTFSETDPPIWTDVFDISKEPIVTVVQGQDCCMQADPTVASNKVLRMRGLEVKRMAHEVGADR